MIDIRAYQSTLTAAGYSPGPADGVWGQRTQNANSRFQRKIGRGVPSWLSVAENEMGVAEYEGQADNPRILEYHRHTTLGAAEDEVAWCSAFVNWCFDMAGLDGSNSAAARSWLDWGNAVAGVRYGCVAVFSRGTGWQGHVAFAVAWDGDSIACLGGNQSDKVCVHVISTAHLLGLRWPTPAMLARLAGSVQ